MKKIILVTIMLLCVVGSIFINLKYNEDDKTIEKDDARAVESDTLPFVDIKWTRATEEDIEYISFSSDGQFSYYCACGNPVNDSDLCETYTYDEDTKIITLDCNEVTDDTIQKIKVISHTDEKLLLDFDGEERIFEIED